MRYPTLMAMTILCGCASQTGVMANGPDTYSILITGGSGFVSSGSLKARAYQQAASYCAGRGKIMEIVDDQEQRGGVLGKFPEAQIKFRCISHASAPAKE